MSTVAIRSRDLATARYGDQRGGCTCALPEQPEVDKELGAYRVYLADRKVEIATAQAETSLAEDQRAKLSAQREKARLDSRTVEADTAKGQVASQLRPKVLSRRLRLTRRAVRPDAAHVAAANSEQQAVELRRQIDVLQAKPTDRGLIVTLGDVLFMTGRADLQASAAGNLNKYVDLPQQIPRTVLSAHRRLRADSVGSEDFNQGLSERRARLGEIVSGWAGYCFNT